MSINKSHKHIPLFALALILSVNLISGVYLYAAEAVKVTTRFDKRTADVSEQIQMEIFVSGAASNVLAPRLPAIDGFDMYYAGRRNQVSIINGIKSSSTTFTYLLAPTRPGNFTLPPLEVQVDGQSYQTSPIALEITGGNASGSSAQTSQPQAGAQAPTNNQSRPSPSTVQPGDLQPTINNSEIFMRLVTDKLQAYPGEQVMLTYTIYTRLSARAEQFEEDPDLSGFWAEEIPIPKDNKPERVSLEGAPYLKADIKRIALFPTSTGQVKIDPGVFRVMVKKEARPSSLFDEFFDQSFFGGSAFSQRETRLLTAEPLNITVRPLPKEGQPADFSGTVGEYTLKSSVDLKMVKQNEPVQLTLVFEGLGNLEILEKPPIAEIEGVKVYDTDTSTEIKRGPGGISGRKTFEITFIPSKEGTFDIPSMVFTYFSPRENRYQTIKTPLYQIKVNPGEKEDPLLMLGREGKDARKTISVKQQDVHYIKEGFVMRDQALVGPPVFRGVAIAGALFTFMGIGCFFYRRRQDKLSHDVALKRRLYATRTLKQHLKKVRRLASNRSPEGVRKLYEEVARAMFIYFADIFNLSNKGLTFRMIEDRLSELAIDKEMRTQLRHLFETAEMAQFATSSSLPDLDLNAHLTALESLARILEKKK